jgi:hypothetical protein
MLWGGMADEFDLKMMQRAMELARAAADAGEAPIGAVVVDPATREVVAEAYNEPIGSAIRRAMPRYWRCGRRQRSWAITGFRG